MQEKQQRVLQTGISGRSLLQNFINFTGQAQKCSDLVDIYIMSSRLELKLSACMLYVYSNLTLGNAKASERGLRSSGNV